MLVGKVHANAAPMRSGLMRMAVGAGLLLVSSRASAEDAGDHAAGDDAAPAVVAPDGAAPLDGATIACDGALCETQTGTTCDLAGVSPGRISPSFAGAFGILGAVILAASRRRSARIGERGHGGAPRPTR